MRQDLNTLKLEFERALDEGGFVVFRGSGRVEDSPRRPVFWDAARYPEPKQFLAVATALAIKVVVYHDREFTAQEIEEAFDKLEASALPRDDYRETERNLRKLQAYEGFTCMLEISFDYQGELYVYDSSTSWYLEFLGILDELDDMFTPGPEPDPGSMGGFFSQN